MRTIQASEYAESGKPAVERAGAASADNERPQLKLKEVLFLAAMCYLVYGLVIAAYTNYWSFVKHFGDNQLYVMAADGIRNWDFASIHTWQFWGLPYAMVVFSFLTRAPFLIALMFFSVAGCFVSVVFCYQLWGGWVAAIFAVASREWMERSLLGGAEPLFMALVLGSFLAARRQRWLLAALLASFSTVVRPMGIFALLGIGLVLLYRKEYRRLAMAVAVGLIIGVLYILPMKIYLHDPLANVAGYGQSDNISGKFLTYPFGALLRPPTALREVRSQEDGTSGTMTKLNLARVSIWIIFVLLGIAAMFRNRRFRELSRTYPVEFLFCVLYLGLMFTYNSRWARTTFPRYAIPVLPFLILAIEPWIPKDRRLLWAFGLGSAVLAAASTIGIREFLATVHKAI